MRIRMLKPFNALKAGQELEQTDGVAELWIACGRAERLVPPETVTITPAAKRKRIKKPAVEAV